MRIVVFSPSMVDRNEYRFRQRLADQLNFLTSSCQQYDRGYRYEAVRIAQAMRVLFYDTKDSTTSLLTHLRAKDRVWLRTSCPEASSTATEYYGMGMQTIDVKDAEATRKFEPILTRKGIPHTAVPVRYWWDMEVLVSSSLHPSRVAANHNNEPTRLRRSDIILNTANKDGGAHVDKNLPPEYEWLTSSGPLPFLEGMVREFQLEPLVDVHYVFLRQMAYEVLNSPDLIKMLELPNNK